MNTRPLERTGGASILADAAHAAWRAAARILRTLRHRSQVRELLEFDDRMLADIGISRHDLYRALDTPVLRDASHLLADIRHEARLRRPDVRRKNRRSDSWSGGSHFR
jgi:uncharacterized protein YjiS (DUF1127 family)